MDLLLLNSYKNKQKRYLQKFIIQSEVTVLKNLKENENAMLFPLCNSKIKGRFFSFIIKGYGKRAKYSPSLFLFRVGLRTKANLNVNESKRDSLPKSIIPSSVVIKSKKKSTLFTLFSSNFIKTRSFLQSIIKLQGSSKSLPAFSYKDIGIRYFGQKPIKKVRRVS